MVTASLRRAAYLQGAGALALMLGVCGPAVAAEVLATDTPAPTAGESVLQEIVVTARRRAEALERVPVAVNAISGQGLVDRSVTSQADLQTATPGLIVRSTNGNSQFNYAIRGQSVDAFSSSQPGVLGYVDEFQTTALSAGSFYDLESVQVLKGPQGTLFGRNTTGGAVLYSTAKPSFDGLSGFIRGRYGRFDLRQVEGSLNLPAGDTLAFRVAATLDRRDGYVKNLVDGKSINSYDRKSVRGSARWQPTSSFDSNFVAQYDHATGNGDAMLLYSAYAPGQIGPDGHQLVASAGTFYSQGLDNLAGAGAFAALLSAFPQTTSGGIVEAAALQRARGTRVVANDSPLGMHAESYYLVNISTLKLGSDAQLKNIFGYAFNRSLRQQDQDGSPFPFYSFVDIKNRSRSLSEELNLSGQLFDRHLNYIGGIYYSRDKQLNGQDFAYFDLGPVANPILGPAFGTTALPLRNQLFGSAEIDSIAAYLQGTYSLDSALPGLGATAGLRYTKETYKYTELSGFLPAFQPGLKESRKDAKPSWTVGLEYQATPGLFMYVNYRGSWRGGGFNNNAPPVNALAPQGGNSFKPETIEDIEFGGKFRGKVGTVPIRMNVALYKSWVNDVQRVAYVSIPGFGPAAVTVNVPGAEFYGVEADGSVQLTPWLAAGGAFTYISAKYTGAASQDLFGTFLQFSTFADIAKYSGSVYAEISVPINAHSRLSLRGDTYAQSSAFMSNFGRSEAPGTELPGYSLTNLRLAVDNIGESGVTAALFAKNLFDKEYYVGGIGLGSQAGYNLAIPGTPRIVGVELDYKF